MFDLILVCGTSMNRFRLYMLKYQVIMMLLGYCYYLGCTHWAFAQSSELTAEQKKIVYPQMALKAGVTGKVVLKVWISTRAKIEKIKVVNVDPSGLGFEESAINYGQTVLFPVKKIQGIAVRYQDTIRIEFTAQMLAYALQQQGNEEEARYVLLNAYKASSTKPSQYFTEQSRYGAGKQDTQAIGLSIHSATRQGVDSKQTVYTKPLPKVTGPTVTFEGQILEGGSKIPIPDAIVKFTRFDALRLSDQKGYFNFFKVPAGRIKVEIKRRGYASLEQWVLLTPDSPNIFKKFYLKSVSFETQKRQGVHIPPHVITRYDINQEELQSIAGIDSDAIQAVRDLPGVYRVPFNMGPLVMRGGLTGGAYLLGSPMMRVQHQGGNRSMIPSLLIGQLHISHDYGLEQARFGGGILDVQLKKAPYQGLEAQVEMNAWELMGMVGAPISPYLTITGATRIGLMPTWVDHFDLRQQQEYAPRMAQTQDTHFRLTYRHDLHHIDLLISSFLDSSQASNPIGRLENPSQRGTQEFSLNGLQMHGQWTYENPKHRYHNKLNFSLGVQNEYQTPSVDGYSDTLGTQIHIQDQFKMRINKPLWFNAGLEQFAQILDFQRQGVPLSTEGQGRMLPRSPRDFVVNNQMLSYQPAAWLGLEARWLRVHLLAGSRVQYFSDTGQVTAEPRLTLRTLPFFGSILKLGAGMYTKQIDLQLLDPTLGNGQLKHEQHIYTSAGIEQKITQQLYIDITGFYRDLKDRVRINSDPMVRFSSDGTGYAKGVETLLRYKMDHRFYGWIAYNFVQARLKDGNEAEERMSDWDQTHQLSVLLGAKIISGLSLNTRWRFTSGMPYSDIPDRTFDSDRGQFSFATNQRINPFRMQSFHQLDLRLDYEWNFEQWKLLLYVQMNHVYAQESEEMVHPLAGVNQNAPEFLHSWPRWSSLGVRATF